MKLIQRATNWTVFFALLIEGLAWGGLERFLPGVFVLVLVLVLLCDDRGLV